MEGESAGEGGRLRVAAESEVPASEWDTLVAATGGSPFMRHGWIDAWRAAFGSGGPLLLTARRGESLVGLLPLQSSRGVLSSPSNWHTPEFAPLARDRGTAQALLAAAAARARRRVDLLLLPRAGTAAALAGGLPAGRARVLIRTVERSPWVSLAGTWEQFEASLPGKRRADLRRRKRRLEEEVGEVECVSHDGTTGLSRLLADGFAVEASGWKGEGGTAVNAEPAARRFYEGAGAWAAEAGLLNLWFLRAGGRPLAFAYCITDAEAHYVLKIGFDPAYSRYAPGMLLTRKMLVDAFRRGLRRYEFLGQDDAYKLVWTDRIHERERLQVFPHGPLGAGDLLAWRHGRPLAKRLLSR